MQGASSTALPKQLADSLKGIRFRVWLPSEVEELPRIENGILFVFARWSGPAIKRGRGLIESIRLSGDSATTLVLVDSDHLSSEAWRKLGATPQGFGETFWFRDGEIVARDPNPVAPSSRPVSAPLRSTDESRLRRQYRRALADGDTATANSALAEIRARYDPHFT